MGEKLADDLITGEALLSTLANDSFRCGGISLYLSAGRVIHENSSNPSEISSCRRDGASRCARNALRRGERTSWKQKE